MVAKLEFDGVIEPARGGGALVRLPADAADVFGTRARFPVRATFNGVAYQGSTMPTGDGTFCLGVTKAVQAKAGVQPGDGVRVIVERDDAPREVEVPDDLDAALARHPAARDRFAGLSYTHRKEYVQWVSEAKKEETRRRRIDRALELLAERGGPPQ